MEVVRLREKVIYKRETTYLTYLMLTKSRLILRLILLSPELRDIPSDEQNKPYPWKAFIILG